MNNEKLKIWIGFYKFLLGTLGLSAISIFVNREIQHREIEINREVQSRQIEIEEQELISKYIEYALEDEIGPRKRFAEYFKTVTRSETLRDRWRDYFTLVQAEYDLKEMEKQKLMKQASSEKLTTTQLETIQTKISKIESQLNPTPTNIRNTNQSIRNYTPGIPANYLTYVSLDAGHPEDVRYSFIFKNGKFVHGGNGVFSSDYDPIDFIAYYDPAGVKRRAKLLENGKQFEVSKDEFKTKEFVDEIIYLDWDKKPNRLTPADTKK
ncbi:hypothetical protein VDG1235_2303 [Verrucomicrobiia bacterium DG1235]|nr:hypothetical protein VDG1235_2303 [Verrucomicrobiae bacterium DG1235]